LHYLLIFLIGCIFILFAYRIFRLIFKRISFYIRLKNICRSTGAKIYPTHIFWLFGGQYTGIADFHIETEDNIYSVKFWGAFKYKQAFDFIDPQKVAIRSYHLLAWGFFKTEGWGKPKIKKIHEMYFEFKRIDDPDLIKKRIRILLFLPAPMLVTENLNDHKYAGILKREKEMTERMTGDFIMNRFYLFSGKSFLDVLRLNASEFPE